MIVNGKSLLAAQPILSMVPCKVNGPGGTSYGLGEAGYDIRVAQTLILFPGRRFRLASTMEQFDMPLNLLGEVADKSTWARRKLTVQNTKIEPGWRGTLTLELIYHGYRFLRVPAGSGIAQIVFHELIENGDYGDGKYQDQEARPVKARNSGVQCKTGMKARSRTARQVRIAAPPRSI